MVDVLIESYCEDAGITPRELVDALKSTDKSTKLSYRERVSQSSTKKAVTAEFKNHDFRTIFHKKSENLTRSKFS